MKKVMLIAAAMLGVSMIGMSGTAWAGPPRHGRGHGHHSGYGHGHGHHHHHHHGRGYGYGYGYRAPVYAPAPVYGVPVYGGYPVYNSYPYGYGGTSFGLSTPSFGLFISK